MTGGYPLFQETSICRDLISKSDVSWWFQMIPWHPWNSHTFRRFQRFHPPPSSGLVAVDACWAMLSPCFYRWKCWMMWLLHFWSFLQGVALSQQTWWCWWINTTPILAHTYHNFWHKGHFNHSKEQNPDVFAVSSFLPCVKVLHWCLQVRLLSACRRRYWHGTCCDVSPACVLVYPKSADAGVDWQLGMLLVLVNFERHPSILSTCWNAVASIGLAIFDLKSELICWLRFWGQVVLEPEQYPKNIHVRTSEHV